jgi:EAL domain-containing protein (putative c-di-GMP-specific phosphodiesterase class I)
MAECHSAEPAGSADDLLPSGPDGDSMLRILKTVRRHMGMNVAFVSRFREFDRVLEQVDSDIDVSIRAGDTVPLDEGLCLKVVRGELPGVIPDLEALGLRQNVPGSVPVMLEGNELYGTLCCFSRQPEPDMSDRDLRMMRGFAEVLADRISEIRSADRQLATNAAAVRQMIAGGDPHIVFQPMYKLSSDQLVGVECLSRFHTYPIRPPNVWFDLAHSAGLGQELELLAIRKSVEMLSRFPREVFVCVNSSPDAILAGKLDTLLANTEVERLVLEITEHSIVADYKLLAEALSPLRKRGLRLAIDDAGAGYANMRHILNLLPDTIKLDMSLTRNIDTDPHRRALARALINFAEDIGSSITAEGVETAGELAMLRRLGVDQAQGYFLGRPRSLEEVLRLLH